MYYGINLINNKPIDINRRNFDICSCSIPMNTNRIICGQTGTGKTFMMKTEILDVLKNTNDKVFIITEDSGDYSGIVREFGGQLISMTMADNISGYMNVPDSRFTAIDIKGISQYARSDSYGICLNSVWDSIKRHTDGISWLFLDDIRYLMQTEHNAEILAYVSAHARENKCILTVSTQNITDFLMHNKYGYITASNCNIVTALHLAKNDIETVCNELSSLPMSEIEKYCGTNGFSRLSENQQSYGRGVHIVKAPLLKATGRFDESITIPFNYKL